MKALSPKPLISEVLQTWRIAPGMTFALISDVERQLWVQESCPVGSHFWTLDQSEELVLGERTSVAMKELIAVGREYESRHFGSLDFAPATPSSGEHVSRRSEMLHLEKQRVAEALETGKTLVKA